MTPRKWPRPARKIGTRKLGDMLGGLEAWNASLREPVVGRIREETRDPFAVLVGTVLSLRTRDSVTEAAFDSLWRVASTPEALAAMPVSEIENAIRPVGFFRNKSRHIKQIAREIIGEHDGEVPRDLEELLSLPGVGRKTANLVLTEAFGLPGICVDTHVHRILNWWGYVDTGGPDETEMVLRKTLPRRWWIPINGLLVNFGQRICRPVGPKCDQCPLFNSCSYTGKKHRTG